MPRDSQKSKLYRAERITFGTDPGGHYPIDFSTTKDVQNFVNRVTKSAFWREAGGRAFVHVKPVPDRQYARGWAHMIEIPPWAKSRPVVLHELAHALAIRFDWSDATHGPGFVFLFRRLIEQELGIDERRRFDRVAEEVGVQWGMSAAMKRHIT